MSRFSKCRWCHRMFWFPEARRSCRSTSSLTETVTGRRAARRLCQRPTTAIWTHRTRRSEACSTCHCWRASPSYSSACQESSHSLVSCHRSILKDFLKKCTTCFCFAFISAKHSLLHLELKVILPLSRKSTLFLTPAHTGFHDCTESHFELRIWNCALKSQAFRVLFFLMSVALCVKYNAVMEWIMRAWSTTD